MAMVLQEQGGERGGEGNGRLTVELASGSGAAGCKWLLAAVVVGTGEVVGNWGEKRGKEYGWVKLRQR